MTGERRLKTSWTHPGGGATVGALLRAMNRVNEIKHGDETLRTDLQINVTGALTDYDIERAEMAIREARMARVRVLTNRLGASS